MAHDIVDRHSFFQLKHFIVDREYTHQGKLWQCLREIRSRKTSLKSLKLEIEAARDQMILLHNQDRAVERDLGRLKIQATPVPTPSNATLAMYDQAALEDDVINLTVTLRQVARRIKSQQDQIDGLYLKAEDLEAEISFFLDTFETLNAKEMVKPFDDPEAQKDYWTKKFLNEINIKTLLGLPLDVELVKTVLALNDDSPVKTQMIEFLNTVKLARVKQNKQLDK